MAPGQNQSKLSVVDLTKSMLNVGNMLKDLAQESSAPGISIIPSQQHTTQQALAQSVLHPLSQILNTINTSELSSILPVPQTPSLETIEASLLLNPIHKETRGKELSILPTIQEEEERSLANSSVARGQEIRRETLNDKEGVMKLENYTLQNKKSAKIDVYENIDFFKTQVVDRSIQSTKRRLQTTEIKQLVDAQKEVQIFDLLGGLPNLLDIFSEKHGWIFMVVNPDETVLERVELSTDENPYLEAILSKLRQKSYDMDDFSGMVSQAASLVRVRERLRIKVPTTSVSPSDAVITKEKNLVNSTILSEIQVSTPIKGGIDLSNKGLQKLYRNTQNVPCDERNNSVILCPIVSQNKIAEFFYLLYKTQKNGSLNIFQVDQAGDSNVRKVLKFEVVSNPNQQHAKSSGMFKTANIRESLELKMQNVDLPLEASRSVFENLNCVQEKLRVLQLRPSEKRRIEDNRLNKSLKDGSQKLKSSLLKNIISQNIGIQGQDKLEMTNAGNDNSATVAGDISSHPLLLNIDTLGQHVLNNKEKDALKLLIQHSEANAEGTKEFFIKSRLSGSTTEIVKISVPANGKQGSLLKPVVKSRVILTQQTKLISEDGKPRFTLQKVAKFLSNLATIDEVEESTHQYSSADFRSLTLETFDATKKKKKVQTFQVQPSDRDIESSTKSLDLKEFELTGTENLDFDMRALSSYEDQVSGVLSLFRGLNRVLEAKSSSFMIKEEKNGDNKVYDLCLITNQQGVDYPHDSEDVLHIKERVLFDLKSNLAANQTEGDLWFEEKLRLLQLHPGNRAIREYLANGLKITEIIEAPKQQGPGQGAISVIESTQTQFKPPRSHEILQEQVLPESVGIAVWHMQEQRKYEPKQDKSILLMTITDDVKSLTRVRVISQEQDFARSLSIKSQTLKSVNQPQDNQLLQTEAKEIIYFKENDGKSALSNPTAGQSFKMRKCKPMSMKVESIRTVLMSKQQVANSNEVENLPNLFIKVEQLKKKDVEMQDSGKYKNPLNVELMGKLLGSVEGLLEDQALLTIRNRGSYIEIERA